MKHIGTQSSSFLREQCFQRILELQEMIQRSRECILQSELVLSKSKESNRSIKQMSWETRKYMQQFGKTISRQP